jgi:hypothetical protein
MIQPMRKCFGEEAESGTRGPAVATTLAEDKMRGVPLKVTGSR